MCKWRASSARKLGSLDNHRQEPWKARLPEFIEHLYFKRFGRERRELRRDPADRGQLGIWRFGTRAIDLDPGDGRA